MFVLRKEVNLANYLTETKDTIRVQARKIQIIKTTFYKSLEKIWKYYFEDALYRY